MAEKDFLENIHINRQMTLCLSLESGIRIANVLFAQNSIIKEEKRSKKAQQIWDILSKSGIVSGARDTFADCFSVILECEVRVVATESILLLHDYPYAIVVPYRFNINEHSYPLNQPAMINSSGSNTDLLRMDGTCGNNLPKNVSEFCAGWRLPTTDEIAKFLSPGGPEPSRLKTFLNSTGLGDLPSFFGNNDTIFDKMKEYDAIAAEVNAQLLAYSTDYCAKKAIKTK